MKKVAIRAAGKKVNVRLTEYVVGFCDSYIAELNPYRDVICDYPN